MHNCAIEHRPLGGLVLFVSLLLSMWRWHWNNHQPLERLIIYFPSVIFKSSQFNCVKITICSPQKVTKMVSFRAFFFCSQLSQGEKNKTSAAVLCTKVIFRIIWICLASDFSHIFVLTSEHHGTLKYLKLESTIWLWPGTGDSTVHCWTLQISFFLYMLAFTICISIFLCSYLLKCPKVRPAVADKWEVVYIL